MRNVITRAAAKKQGLSRYLSGKPCKNGNISERLVSSYECLCPACHDEKRRKQAGWYAENRDEQLKRVRNNQERNRLSTKKWRIQNPGSVKAYRKRLAVEKPHLNRIKVASRRAARNQRTPLWFGEFDRLVLEEAADLAIRRESASGIGWHVDHMIPLRARTASGLHCGANIQVIPETLNVRKHNKLWLTKPGEWVWHA